MANEPARIPRLGWAVAFLAAAVAITAAWMYLKSVRPEAAGNMPPIAKVPPFEFTAQDGRTVTRSDLDGKVWVATFVFTRCAGPCPAISAKMAELNRVVGETKGDVRLVSVTVDPEYDTPDVLAQYGKSFGADPSQWIFLTGDAAKIEQFVVKGMLQPLMKNPGNPPAHSQRFVIVGRDGNIRSYHDLNEPELMQKLLMDIGVLLREPASKVGT